MDRTLIRGGYVLSIDPQIGELPEGDVLVQDGRIVAVGAALDVQDAAVIDARDRIVMPGFVDIAVGGRWTPRNPASVSPAAGTPGPL